MAFTLATVGGRITAVMYNEHASGVRLYKAATTTVMNAITDMAEGDLCLVTADNITRRYTAGSWVRWSSPWISFAPVLTNMAIGTGGGAFNVSEYKYTDGEYRQRGRIVFGSTGATFPTTPDVGLPTGIVQRAPLIANELLLGSVTLFDTGVAIARGYVGYPGTVTSRVRLLQNAATAGGTAGITTTSPWTWNAGDAIEYDFIGKMP